MTPSVRICLLISLSPLPIHPLLPWPSANLPLRISRPFNATHRIVPLHLAPRIYLNGSVCSGDDARSRVWERRAAEILAGPMAALPLRSLATAYQLPRTNQSGASASSGRGCTDCSHPQNGCEIARALGSPFRINSRINSRGLRGRGTRGTSALPTPSVNFCKRPCVSPPPRVRPACSRRQRRRRRRQRRGRRLTRPRVRRRFRSSVG